MILEFTGETGELIIEIDQELLMGSILNHDDLKSDKDMIFFEVHSITPSTFHYSIDSNLIPYSVSLIIFRPENLKDSELNIKINYSKMSNCKKSNEICIKNLSEKSGLSDTVIYTLIGVGGFLALIIIILLIWCLVRKKPEPRAKSVSAHSPIISNRNSLYHRSPETIEPSRMFRPDINFQQKRRQ
jgi:hypothetical protein